MELSLLRGPQIEIIFHKDLDRTDKSSDTRKINADRWRS